MHLNHVSNSLTAIAVETAEQVERLRHMRNATAYGFSNDVGQISMQHQHAWWIAMRGRVRAWLYQSEDQLIGFGMLRQTEDGKWWNSLGVLPAYQRHGYGAEITHDLLLHHQFRSDVGNQPLYATVRRENLAALAMHHEQDWDIIDGDDERLTYFRSKQ